MSPEIVEPCSDLLQAFLLSSPSVSPQKSLLLWLNLIQLFTTTKSHLQNSKRCRIHLRLSKKAISEEDPNMALSNFKFPLPSPPPPPP